MPGSLSHSPAEVLRQLFIDLGYGTDPGDNGSWPIYVANEPHVPDNCITVYDTVGRDTGRVQISGELQEHAGFQFRIRSATYSAGYVKANAIAIAMDETVYQNNATVGSTTYLVHSITRTSSVLAIGSAPDSQRELFTINGVALIRQQ